ncbi:unnamed protein product [Paramecium octaurelia]|uniref:Uncharacterized protein n=1 Tax=Paramecium octaurelia TaxID=43137 RepID=A0A8S1V4J7_PAROT|nr:unnamed protein product [Paramecium octaurelia]
MNLIVEFKVCYTILFSQVNFQFSPNLSQLDLIEDYMEDLFLN